MISQNSFRKAWENRKLVGGALKAAHVRPDYHLYEDLFQEGLIVYAEMLEELATNKARTEIDKLSFKKVLWRTLNRLKREQRVCERSTNMDEAYDLGEEADWNNLVVLKQEVNKLSKMEQVIFYDHLLSNKKITELAAEYRIARRTLTRLKHDLFKLRKMLVK
ncbi:sigma-70 family RNA polymerase sigma factor [Lactobacillus helveticus]|uniref:RNA polymerase sigma factor, sigma-70 family n=1 Tax=Lactobacillus helveticus CIRM-BIA 951 TaxID=1226334 RepID=U6F0Z2_LACHE|nr:DNA-directed RNA polymerase sigma-70 factor [Lactobacillus helveticus]MDY0990576.1 sigma-70 family RNA polymerase sigma factor [Lactobacillus helveticus]MDY1001256.1 sigma-70 family RNA polymerase sigma factor [Lactobacillus helveticus]MEB2873097.1 sigma-70 family RNA polymerase sigma factor [Lactobacillus helveticus]CDI57777.1 RNA polymerase sigma factor, sigma-70 family [Lactobacillus helveticus CIRM-BIA 951]